MQNFFPPKEVALVDGILHTVVHFRKKHPP